MSTTALADLDELVLLCRDERARSYLKEAVACYRGGAYRAAIVATWVAVCFDIIDKLRELTLAGDKQAEKITSDLEKTRQTNDLSGALKFERDLLKLARDSFDLLSHLECIDLERLQEDRNRCAHPSLVSEEQAFSPPAELARLHIYSAVTHLLQHAPVQGKYALDRVLREITSEYFPSDVPKATAYLSSGPLKRPRESLVRNFTLVLVKQFLDKAPDWKQRCRIHAALGAVKALHGNHFEAILKEKLPAIFQGIEDQNLFLSAQFVCKHPESWLILSSDVQHRLENFVENLPSGQLYEIDELIDCKPFKVQATRRAARVTKAEIKDQLFLPVALIERSIDFYLSSTSFSQANDFAKTLITNLSDFSAVQQERLLKGVAANSEVMGSFELGAVINALRQTEEIPLNDFEKLLNDNGLEKFMLSNEG